MADELISDPVAGNRRLVLVARLGLLVACTSIAWTQAGVRGAGWVAGTLLLAAAIGSVPPHRLPTTRLSPPVMLAVAACLEAVVTCLLVLLLRGGGIDALPYLLAPALAAGVGAGPWAASTVALTSSVTLTGGWLLLPTGLSRTQLVTPAHQWVLMALLVGLLAAWVRREQRAAAVAPGNSAYESAYRLISQLRLVARQLSVGLDQVALAQALLQSLRGVMGYERAAVYVRSSGGRLVPLAFEGCESVDWPLDLGPGTLFGEVWSTQRPVQRAGGLSPSHDGHSLALPLRIGSRTFGVVGLEDRRGPFDGQRVEDAMAMAEEAALRIETAMLFAEVRSVAVVDERRRLAREIHDGIAQELASLGYVVDDLARRTDGELHQDLRDLRTELTRVITDLRLSIFDLRSEVQQVGGLGSALSEHVRQVGASSGLTVHLILDEGPEPLTVATEAELLRIAQEAVTNARRHAGAHNLWVTCVVESPRARLRIEDDGVGLRQGRPDSFGLEIMRERAQRIGGRLDIRDREEGGTVVEVSVGEPAASVSSLAGRSGGRRDHDRAAG